MIKGINLSIRQLVLLGRIVGNDVGSTIVIIEGPKMNTGDLAQNQGSSAKQVFGGVP
jgi:hypothetical protein